MNLISKARYRAALAIATPVFSKTLLVFKSVKQRALPLFAGLALTLIMATSADAQTQFWSDTFEDTGAPSAGTRTPSINIGFPTGGPYAYYFMRTNGTDLALQAPFTNLPPSPDDPFTTYQNVQGSKFWAGEDTDRARTGVADVNDKVQQIEWTGINISGKTGLSFKGLFAAHRSMGWQNPVFGATYDFLMVEYKIDGGSWTKAGGFYSDLSATNAGFLREDTNGDLTGDGAYLTKTFQEFGWAITGTGTTLSLRFKVSADGASTQEFAIDNFRLFNSGTSGGPAATSGNVEYFEGATANSQIFSNSATALGFTLTNKFFIQNVAGYGVQSANPPTTPATGSNFYIDNFANQATNQVNSIKTTNKGLFAVKSLWAYPSSITDGGQPTNNGTLTFTGKKNGATVYTFTKSGIFQATVNLGANYNGFTYIDFSVGTDNSNTLIDELEISLGSTYKYLAIDNFAFTATPSIVNAAATSITTGTATINANVNPSASATSAISFDYSTSPTLASGVTNVAATPSTLASANTATGVSAGITGLAASTTYYYRAKATNTIGTNNNSTILSFTTSAPAGVLLSTSPTLHFANSTGFGDNIAEDGEGGSTAISDINIQTYPINSSIVKITGSPLTYYDTNSSGWTGYPGIISYGDASSFYGWAIKSSDGSNFSLASLNFLDWGNFNGATFKIEAFDGGVSKGSLSFAGNTTTAFKALSQTSGVPALVLPAAFGNVDEVRVYQADAGNSYIALNDVKVGTAVAAVTPTVTGNPPNRTVCIGSNTTFSVTASDATGYQWQVNNGGGFSNVSNGAPYSGANTATLTITGVTAGLNTYQYRCVVSNGAVNVNSNSGTLTAPSINLNTSSQTNILCYGGNTGAASVTPSGGIAPYTYSWSPSGGTAATATGLIAGTYTVTVTDNLGCQATKSFTITEPASAVNATFSTQTNIACFGATTGSATVSVSGGTPGYTYSWAPSGGTAATASGLSAGTYIVTVTDANGCTDTQSFTITQPASAVNATASTQTNILCFGAATGSATVSVTGGSPGYTYSWAPSGGTAATASGLSAGTYTVTVTDANGCTDTQSFTIAQPASAVNATASAQTNILCFGAATGSATVSVSGGTPGYTYSWAPSGGTAATATGLAAGTYTVTVTDANGCTDTQSFTISQPAAALNATAGAQTNILCFGTATGSATVSVSGGTPGYTYSWAPSGGTAATATGLAAGTYTVTVTDANGCTDTQSFTINQPAAALNATFSAQTNIACFGAATGSATVSVSGGTPGYTYSWAPSGGTAATATGLIAGTYMVTVTDANGCTDTQSFTISQPATAITASISATAVTSYGGSNGTATVSPNGGTPGYTYSWAPSGGTAATATGLTAGTYTVTITDNNGCQLTKTITVSQPAVITGVSSSDANGTYKFGTAIQINVNFSEAVTVTGTPTLGLNTGGSASYASGSGTSALTFTYNVGTVQALDLDYSGTTALSLNGGTIRTSANIDATLTLATPGASGSLGANKNFVVDGIAPTISSIVRINSSPTNATSVAYTVTFTENVTGVDFSDFNLTTTGALNASISSITGSGSSYTVNLTSVSGTGTLRLDLKSSGTGIEDAATNAISTGYNSGQVYDIDQTPAISTTGSLSALSTTYGTVSSTSSFNVSAVNLISGVSITAPSGFELSTNSGSAFADQLTVGSSGSLSSTAIYVRLKANAKATLSPYAGNITLSSLNAANVTVATINSTVAVKPITLTLNNSPLITKTYNASTAASLVPGNYNLIGLETGDVVTVSGTAVYNNKNIGTGKIVTANTFVLAGADQANYSLTTTSATTTGAITAKTLTLALNALPSINKTYDGLATATLVPSNYTLTGIVGAETVVVSGSASYDTKTVGAGKTITANTFVLAGADAGNYSLTTTTATTTGTITAKPLTLALNAIPSITKTYNGSTAASLASSNYTLTGIVGADVVNVSGTAVYDNMNIGTGKTITANTFVLAGADAANYSLTTTSATTTGAITAKNITLALNALPAITKTYDGLTTASLATGNYTLTGVVGGETVTVTGTANYDTKLIGTGKTITVNTFVLGGVDAANYALSTTTATTTGAITAKVLTLTLNAAPAISKTYDGLTTANLATGNYNLIGVVGAETVTVTGTASYDTKAAGTGKVVTANNFVLAGADVGNYTLSTTTTSTTGIILQKIITVTAVAKAKIYGAVDPALTYTFTPALISGDNFTGGLTRTAGENVGNHAINQGTLALSGDYQIAFTSANLAISKRDITVLVGAVTKVYGAPDPVLMYGTSEPLPFGDTFTGNLVRVPGENVGEYAINVGTLTLNPNYNLFYAIGKFTITPKPIVVSADAQSKIYGDADPQLTYTTGGLVNGDALTGVLARTSGENVGNYTIAQGTLSGNANYTISFNGNILNIVKKSLVIKADDKLKSQGANNPQLTASYTGFKAGETNAVLTTQPVFSTTALISSPKGTYSISVGGASATNYTITYQNGTLTIAEAKISDITMTSSPVYEGIAVGTGIGQLRSISENLSASFTYSLVAGAGSTDNALFTISGNALQVAGALDYETKANYSIRVRSTDQNGVTFEKTFAISLIDVNEAPTINTIPNSAICFTTNDQVINLTGITAGPETTQTPTLTVTSNNPTFFTSLSVTKGAGALGTLSYKLAPGAVGTVQISITVNDNGGVSLGGVETTIQRFNLTINALPLINISSDKGIAIFKGETVLLTATGGTSYSWANANGIVSGQNTAILTVKPTETTTYTVTATNATGCSEVKTITITVTNLPTEAGASVKATNIMSPNGDGVNDTWVVENIELFPNNSVKIVDRSGRLVYSKKNYDNSWNATFSGLPLAEGTYYYIIDFGDGKTIKKGFITVLRK